MHHLAPEGSVELTCPRCSERFAVGLESTQTGSEVRCPSCEAASEPKETQPAAPDPKGSEKAEPAL